jgi:hypothetical protein
MKSPSMHVEKGAGPICTPRLENTGGESLIKSVLLRALWWVGVLMATGPALAGKSAAAPASTPSLPVPLASRIAYVAGAAAPTRPVVAVSDDDANTFHYLDDFSKGPGAKFINTAISHPAASDPLRRHGGWWRPATRCLLAMPAVGMPVAIIPVVPWSHDDGRGWDDHRRGRRDDDRDRQAESQSDTDPGVGGEGQGQGGETEHGHHSHCPEERAHPLHGAVLLGSVDRSLLFFIVSLPQGGAAHVHHGRGGAPAHEAIFYRYGYTYP